MNQGVGNTFRAMQLAKKAYDGARRSGLRGEHNGPQDAYRHCLWSCLLASEFPDTADDFLNCHEKHTPDTQDSDEETMDNANNKTGKDLAECPGECKTKCWEALMNGSLVGRSGGPVGQMMGPAY